MRAPAFILASLILAVALFYGVKQFDHPRPQSGVAQTALPDLQDSQTSWSKEPVTDPVLAQTLLPGATVEYYDITGESPKELDASLSIFGTDRQGAPAITSYQMVLYKGNPSDGHCGFSDSRVAPDVSMRMPRWVAMPQASDSAKQWWSWKIHQLADQQTANLMVIEKEATEATVLLRGATCANGDALFSDFNKTLAERHGDSAFASKSPDLKFHLPGAVVETIQPSVPTVVVKRVPSAAANPAVYDLALQSLGGESVSLHQKEGQVLFLNFWATWCGFCKVEMPDISALYSRMKGRRIFFACVSNERSETLQSYLIKSGLDLPIYMGTPSASGPYQVTGFPTTFIVSKKGEIVFRLDGYRKWDTPEIEKLLTDLESE